MFLMFFQQILSFVNAISNFVNALLHGKNICQANLFAIPLGIASGKEPLFGEYFLSPVANYIVIFTISFPPEKRARPAVPESTGPVHRGFMIRKVRKYFCKNAGISCLQRLWVLKCTAFVQGQLVFLG